MDVEIRVEPELRGVKVVIRAPARTAEVEALAERLAADSLLCNFGINRLTGQYTIKMYGGDRHGC